MNFIQRILRKLRVPDNSCITVVNYGIKSVQRLSNKTLNYW